MYDIFGYCVKLYSIDVSNFHTSKLQNMQGMFYQCELLKYLDLSNFNTSLTNNMVKMFSYSGLLLYINLKSFKIKNNTRIIKTFQYINQNTKVCLNDSETINLLSSQINNLTCSHICFEENIKISWNENTCFKSCNESQYKYDYRNYCNEKCPNNTFVPEYDNYLCLDKTENGIYYFDNSIGVYKECYQSCKKCHKGGNETNNNCLECKDNYIFLNDSKYQNNCYKICNFYYYFNEFDIYNCTEEEICPEKYNKLIKEKNRCIDNCEKDKIYKYEFNNTCYEQCPNGTIQNNFTCFIEEIIEEDTYLNIIQEYTTNKDIFNNRTENITYNIVETNNITSKIKTVETFYSYKLITDIINNSYFNYSDELMSDIISEKIENVSIENIINNLVNEINLIDINNGIDKKAIKNNLEFIFTSTENQKNNKEENNITIDLCQCEIILKNEYNISENDSLYILVIIYEEEGMKIPKILYEVYSILYNDSYLIKLNLSHCQDTKIEISIPVEINDIIDKYDPKSGYYNDICYKVTSESGTDIILKDRQYEYVENNMSLCEENCELVDYNYTSKKVKCSCNVNLKVPENYVIKFNKIDFFKNFADFKSLTNLNIMKCYKTVLKIKEMKTNYGCIFITFIILFYFISLIIFYFYSFNKLKIHIDKIIFALKFPKEIQENNNNNICENSNKDNNNKIEKKKIRKGKKEKKRGRKLKKLINQLIFKIQMK